MIVKHEGYEVEATEGDCVYTYNVLTSWDFLKPEVQTSIKKLIADIEAKTKELKALIEMAPTDNGFTSMVSTKQLIDSGIAKIIDGNLHLI